MNKRHLIITLLYCVIPLIAAAQYSNDVFKRCDLLFAGDIMQHSLQLETARQGDGTYSYSSYYKNISRTVKDAGIAVANLETPIGESRYGGYPSFCAPDSFVHAIKDAGFDVLLFANNHCLDRGKKGVTHTLDLLDSLGIAYCGVYRNQDEREKRYPLIVENGGIRIALLNYTYGTNGIKVPAPVVVNFIDKEIISADIRKAESMHADAIIACMHWGTEYSSIPQKEIVELSGWLIEEGVDHIIGNHPHVIQPIEIREESETPDRHAVVYSTGNLVSNMSMRGTDGGIIVKMELKKVLFYTRLASLRYLLTWIAPKDGSGKRDFTIQPARDISPVNDSHAAQKLRMFLEDTERLFNRHNKGDVTEFTIEDVGF